MDLFVYKFGTYLMTHLKKTMKAPISNNDMYVPVPKHRLKYIHTTVKYSVLYQVFVALKETFQFLEVI